MKKTGIAFLMILFFGLSFGLFGCTSDDGDSADGDGGADAAVVADPYPDVDSLVPGDSMFIVCLGLDEEFTERFKNTHHIYVIPTSDPVEAYRRLKASEIEHAGYAVINYTQADPTNAPEGHTVICMGTILQYGWEDYWHINESYETYEDFRFNVALTLLERAEVDLGTDGVPLDLASHVESFNIMTPQTMEGFTGNPVGTIFGWAMTPEQSLGNRMPPQSPFDNLLLAGAWTYPGGGQSIAIVSGILAGVKVLKKEGVDVTLPPPMDPVPRGFQLEWVRNLDILDDLKISCSENIYKAIYQDQDIEVDVSSNPEEWRKELISRFPAEEDGINRLFQKMYQIDRVFRVLFRYEYGGQDTTDEAVMMQMLEEVDAMGEVDTLLEIQDLMDNPITLSEFMDEYTKDEDLITIFTHLAGMAGEGPDAVDAIMGIAMWFPYNIGGFCYVEGGSQAISDAQAAKIRENDGVIRLNTKVTKIDIDENNLATGVRTADGTCFKGDYVISNANPIHTFLEMIGEEKLPKTDDPEDPNYLFHPGRIGQPALQPTPSTPVVKAENPKVDQVTGATPGIASAVLTAENHPSAWGVSNCMMCHDGVIADAAHPSEKLGNNPGHYTDAECATCHGTNGSPLMTVANHQGTDNNDSCTTAACHPAEHVDVDYKDSDDCRACHKYDVPQGECAVTETYDVVIIGAGAGGLGAGAYLSQKGYRVVVIEQHHKVGGYMTNFNRGDYRFEISTHGFDGLGTEPLEDWQVPGL